MERSDTTRVHPEADEPVGEMEKFSQNFHLLDLAVTSPGVDQTCLDVYISWVRWVEQGNGSQQHYELCFDTFVPRTIKLVLTTSNLYDQARLEMINTFLLQLFQFTLQRMSQLGEEISATLGDCLMLMCSPYAPLYLTHNLAEEEPGVVVEEEEEGGKQRQQHLTLVETEALAIGDSVRLADGEEGESAEGEIIESSPTDTEVCVLLTGSHKRVWVSKEPSSFLAPNYQASPSPVPPLEQNKYASFSRHLGPAGLLCDCFAHGKWFQAIIILQPQPDQDLLQVHLLGHAPDQDVVVPKTWLAPLNAFSRGRRGALPVCPSLVEDEDLEASLLFTDFCGGNEEDNLRPRKSKSSPKLYIANLNAIFPQLIQVIWHCTGLNLKLGVLCMASLLPYFSHELSVKLAEQLPPHVLHCVESLTKAQVRSTLTKPLISRVLALCHKLLAKVDFNYQGMVVEKIRVECCRKLVESEMIMKRVDGLQVLNELIKECSQQPAAGRVVLNNRAYAKLPRTSRLPSKYLAQWCHKLAVLQSFFHPVSKAHSELIKRSSALVALLCEHELFTEENFELIWSTACGGSDDEDISSASLTLLGQCCQYFPPQVKLLFGRKLTEMSALTSLWQVDLLRDLIQVSPDLALVSCNALWKEAVENGQELACASLEQALRMDSEGEGWEAALRKQIIERCCQSELGNPMLLRVLRASIESFNHLDRRHKLVEWLCVDLNLLGLLVESFRNNVDPVTAGVRLDFLSFVLRNRSETREVDFGTVALLWGHFEACPGSNSTDVFFNWLQKVCRASFSTKKQAGDLAVVVSPATMLAVFDRIRLDKFQSGFAFRVFQASFLGVNLSRGAISQSDTDAVCVEEGKTLLGEDTLWEAALGPHSSDVVAESAAHYISSLRLRTRTSAPWELFGLTIARVLQAMSCEPRGFSRGCSLLIYLVMDCEQEFAQLARMEHANKELWQSIRAHGTLGPFAPACWVSVSNNIKGTVGLGKQFRIHVRANDAVGKVRSRIAESTGGVCPLPEDIRLFAGGNELPLKSDSKSLISLAVQTPHVVACKRQAEMLLPNAIVTGGAAVEAFKFDEWFDPVAVLLLRELGQSSSEQREAKWVASAVRLLDLIPTSKSITAELLREPGAVGATELLFDRDLYRVTYYLQILQDQLHLDTKRLDAMCVRFFPQLQRLLLRRLVKTDREIKPLVLCVSLLRDICRALHVPQEEEQTTEATIGWPTPKLPPLGQEANQMVSSQLDAVALQQCVVEDLLPLAASKGNSNLTRICLDLWRQLIELDQQSRELFDHVGQGLAHVVAGCSHEVGDALTSFTVDKLLTEEQIQLVFDTCLRALPSANAPLLGLVEHLLLLLGDGGGGGTLQILLAKLGALPCAEQFPPEVVGSYAHEPDLCVIGLLRLITVAVNKLDAMEDVPLFQFDAVARCVLGMRGTKCQLPLSRSTAFECVLAICNRLPSGAGDDWFARLFSQAFDTQRFVNPQFTTSDHHLGELSVRSPVGFCGLINLGATCYMNSLFQQLWNVPTLRQQLAELDLPLREGDGADPDVALVCAMQQCFRELSHSTKRVCSLEPFISRFKDESGLGLNVVEQQDAQEIFEKVCDRLDDCLHRQAKGRLFRNALGVKIASVFVCLEDDTKANREDQGSLEWCLKVQLVQGCHSLSAILDKFVAGEVLQQFTWEEEEGGETGKSLRTLKKQVIKSLSDTLAIHLARFHMNWDTQVCEKTNDRLEFPLELDMRPYCDGDQHPPSYYQYKLVGVLVHDGARLNSGHYYSYCQSRVVNSDTNGKWFCFNDSMVQEFDVKNLEEAAFGGNVNKTTARTHGAYMLFYERAPPAAAASSPSPPLPIPRSMLEANHDHLLACRLFDPALLQFLVARCQGNTKLEHGPELKRTKVTESERLLDICASRFLTGECIAARAGGQGRYYLPLAERLGRSFESSCAAAGGQRAAAFLRSLQCTDFAKLLVDLGDYRVGLAFAMLCCIAFKQADDEEEGESGVAGHQAMQRLLDGDVLYHVLRHSTFNTSYWYAVSAIVGHGPQVLARLAFAQGLLPVVFNAVLGGAGSPVYSFEFVGGDKMFVPRTMGIGQLQPPATSWEHAITACISCALIVVSKPSQSPPLPRDRSEEKDREITAMSWQCVRDIKAWALMVEHVESSAVLNSLVLLLSALLELPSSTLTELAMVLASVASMAAEESVSRYLDVVAALPPKLAGMFFLGDQGLFRLMVTHRPIPVAFHCVASFVERVAEEQFPDMLSSEMVERWISNVDEYLRNDALANALDPDQLNRLIHCLEICSTLGGIAADPQQQQVVGYSADDYEEEVGSSSMEDVNSDCSILLEEDEEEFN
ncbi:hypothetical protein BASA81_010251 [Batrachochytrium salamandrivorans]|nr:hypothetical protein BASA81_010251 [Batrachochytrium salamandrivorans]